MVRSLKFLFALFTLLVAGMANAASTNPTKSIRLNKIDPRAINNVTVAVMYSISGHWHYDSEYIGSWDKFLSLEIRQTTGTQDANGVYRGNFLRLTSTGSTCTSNCTMTIAKTDTRTFAGVSVEISFTVNSNNILHYDSESVAMPGAPAWPKGEDFVQDLNVDGRNATLSGGQYGGNLLSTPPQVSSFFWDTNQSGYTAELWAEGVAPYTSGRVYYDSPNFGSQFLFYVFFDGLGIGHEVYSDHFCTNLVMKVSETWAPQPLRIIDDWGNTVVSFTSNSLRPCYFAAP